MPDIEDDEPTDAELARRIIKRAKEKEEQYERTGSYKTKKISQGGKKHILGALLACKQHNEKNFKSKSRRSAKRKRNSFTPVDLPLHSQSTAANSRLRRTKRIKLDNRPRKFGSCYMDEPRSPTPPALGPPPRLRTKKAANTETTWTRGHSVKTKSFFRRNRNINTNSSKRSSRRKNSRSRSYSRKSRSYSRSNRRRRGSTRSSTRKNSSSRSSSRSGPTYSRSRSRKRGESSVSRTRTRTRSPLSLTRSPSVNRKTVVTKKNFITKSKSSGSSKSSKNSTQNESARSQFSDRSLSNPVARGKERKLKRRKKQKRKAVAALIQCQQRHASAAVADDLAHRRALPRWRARI